MALRQEDPFQFGVPEDLEENGDQPPPPNAASLPVKNSAPVLKSLVADACVPVPFWVRNSTGRT